jgi:hypothetical protein
MLGLGCLGCGASGPRRFRISGTVTHAGKPIPAGRIVFEPDTARGGAGPQGFAVIQNGRYDTGRAGAQGAIGGPTVVRIDGFDGRPHGEDTPPLGAPLFPDTYVQTLDLPQKDSTLDFNVP